MSVNGGESYKRQSTSGIRCVPPALPSEAQGGGVAFGDWNVVSAAQIDFECKSNLRPLFGWKAIISEANLILVDVSCSHCWRFLLLLLFFKIAGGQRGWVGGGVFCFC